MNVISSIIWAYLLFLFVGVPIIVFLTSYLKIHAGLAVMAGFILSILLTLWLGFLRSPQETDKETNSKQETYSTGAS